MSRALTAVSLICALATGACGETTDHLGTRRLTQLNPLTSPASYPTPLLDMGVEKKQSDIDSKLEKLFQHLFHDADTAIYQQYMNIEDEAQIIDTYHQNDVRTEGLGLGMMVAVQLNHQVEFDHIWNFAKREKQRTNGADSGYFDSRCQDGTGSVYCLDPFGLEQFTMALIFAKTRFANSPSEINYEADAIELLELMRLKETWNGGVKDNVTNTFDSATHLIYNLPDTNGEKVTRPSIEIPAYYDLWAEATGDSFWSEAADAARLHLANSTSSVGLLPTRSDFAGTPISGYDYFDSECYRALINLAIDYAWFGTTPSTKYEANLLLNFFAGSQIDKYVNSFFLDGSPRNSPVPAMHDPALVAANGALAIAADGNPNQGQFIIDSWGLPLPTGMPRYYTGFMQLLSGLLLAGEYKVY